MTRRWLALGVLTLAVLLIGVDGTVLALATPFIQQDLGASFLQILWIGDIYSFVLAALLISMGSLGDRIGHKKLLLCGATAFALISVLAAYSTSAEMLIVSRALLGVAGATLAPATLALIRGIFPDARERSVAVGIWASAFSAGAALGPVVGGILLEHFWWGSVFLINVPVMVVLLTGGLILLPERRDPKPGPWDLPSVGLSMIGMLGVVYAIKEGAALGIRPDVLTAGMLGTAALILFVRRQLRLPEPLIDVRLFGNRAFSGVVAANLLSVLGLSGLVFFLIAVLPAGSRIRAVEGGAGRTARGCHRDGVRRARRRRRALLVVAGRAHHRPRARRGLDGVVGVHHAVDAVPAAWHRAVPGRRRSRLGVHRGQRRHPGQRAEGSRRRGGRRLGDRLRTRAWRSASRPLVRSSRACTGASSSRPAFLLRSHRMPATRCQPRCTRPRRFPPIRATPC